ncbi:hypothetical protein IDM40_26750 [Nocardiopsis sp. HNM0947]|uniref:DUF2157 domain-containing protein n=1 Tax=Nocardiopsis coralli TaxID=2772213 RepID=A0ABR9PEK9_9ACTN|nr:hypothetical protein [Nocardiopsis coralli]MBE3002272.1 hypothetical protein [Nocardiopsis coralli]
MNQRSEQLVLDYLSEVGLASYGHMTARERTSFLARLRAKIDERRRAAPDDHVDTVRGILRSFGSAEDVVQRECGGRNLDLEDDELIPDRPRHADRPPPPWRGGPSSGIMGLLEGPGQADVDLRGKRTRSTGTLRGIALVVRTHPAEAAALGLMLLTVPWWLDLAFVWVLAAALVALSRVWNVRDTWIGIGVPALACVLAMSLWNGEARYVDEYILESLTATGVIGLGLANLVCVLYLFPRVLRAARSEEESAQPV